MQHFHSLDVQKVQILNNSRCVRPVNTPPCVLKEVWVEAGGGVAGQGHGGGGERVGSLTLDPLQFGAPESHGQVEGDEVLVVAHRHQEVKLHLRQHLCKHT